MFTTRCVGRSASSLLLALGCAGSTLAQGLGVRWDNTLGSQLQTRVRLGSTTVAAMPQLSINSNSNFTLPTGMVFGDYFFRSREPSGGGFRATTGWMLRSRNLSLADAGTPAASASTGYPRISSLAAVDAPADAPTAQPYFGVGYSGWSGKTGVSFSADLGLAAQSTGSVVRLGRVLNGSRTLDDVLREMRLQPLLQLGVNYSF